MIYNENSGVIIIDKPIGWTSHDIVAFIRNKFKFKKVGHCGTLDLMATGVLVILLNSYTKLSQYIIKQDKIYKVVMSIGIETDSFDIEGKTITTNKFGHINNINIKKIFNSFIGLQDQLPPMLSAKKINGIKLYKLARKGIEIKRKTSKINIFYLNINNINLPYIEFTVKCSSGSYIRTLCQDIGKKLGIGAILLKLKRLQIGNLFKINDSLNINILKTIDKKSFNKKIINFSIDSIINTRCIKFKNI